MTERYSLRLIWGDLALPDLGHSFQLAMGPTKMILAFCGVLAVCTLGFVMDTVSQTVVTSSKNEVTASTKTELDEYINSTPKQTKEFIKSHRKEGVKTGVFSTLWKFFSSCFHDASTQLLNFSENNLYSNIRFAFFNIWLCIRAVIWAFRFHPIYSMFYFSILFVVFVFVGGAISRCAALEFAKAEKPGLFEVIGYSSENFRSFLSAPLLPLGLVGVFACVVVLLGLISTIPLFGELLMALLFGGVLFFGFLVTLLVLGSLAGGLLLFPAIAYEKTTGLDSIGRAFSYVLNCPVWMVYYVFLSGSLGTFFYLILRLLIYLALRLTYTLIFAGMMITDSELKLDRIWPKPTVLNFINTTFQPEAWSETAASYVIHLFMLVVVGILLSYIVSYFFSSATVIYALMRKKVDKIGINQIYIHLEQVSKN